MKISRELELIDKELDGIRFTGMDQNPKGIRDRLSCLIRRAETIEKAIENWQSFTDKTIPKINWRDSFLDAEAISSWNEAGISQSIAFGEMK